MEQKEKKKTAKEAALWLGLSRSSLYVWRDRVREYLPPEIAKIYNKDCHQVGITDFEKQLIPLVRRLSTVKKLSPKELSSEHKVLTIEE